VGLFVRRGEQSFCLKKAKSISTTIPHAAVKKTAASSYRPRQGCERFSSFLFGFSPNKKSRSEAEVK